MLSNVPVLPNEPHVEVKIPWGMGECGHGMTLHRDAMLVDLVVEGFAQGDGVAGEMVGPATLSILRSKPQMEMIKEVKS